MHKLKITLAQINCTVGDLEGNADRILQYIEKARAMQANLVCFPEMAITGYPPKDLLLKPDFVAANLQEIDRIVQESREIAVVVGFADSKDGLYNAAAVACNGKLYGIYHKRLLSTCPFFDERRYFRAGSQVPVFRINDLNIGISISEEVCFSEVASEQFSAGAEVMVNLSASPYDTENRGFKGECLSAVASGHGRMLASVNLVGGQDELVFEGGSMVLEKEGQVMARGKQFEEDLVVVDLDNPPAPLPIQDYNPIEEIYAALVLGTRDYIRKNGFSKALLGLSGGLDSGLAAAITVDAVGAENVVAVSMPSQYSSEGSKSDSQLLAGNLGIELKVVPIEQAFRSSLNMLADELKGTEFGVAEENLQARIRGNTLMTLSNKFGWLVLNTGNKSEATCGYCTLYGDMVGGFAVLKDVPKTLVYELARYKNNCAGWGVIPESIIEKEPSAELRPGQRDVDSLPPYEVLDLVLKAYLGENKSPDQIVSMGFNHELVQRVLSRVDNNEYKRRQAPPGIKLTPDKDWQLPMTNRFRSR